MASNKISRRELLGRGLKTGLAAAAGITLAPLIKPLENSCNGDEIVYRTGVLKFGNEIADISGGYWPLMMIHRQGASEYEDGYDSIYNGGPPEKPNTKIMSVVQGHVWPELDLEPIRITQNNGR